MSLARVDAVLDSVTSARPLALVRMLLALGALVFAIEVWVMGLHVLVPGTLAVPFMSWLPRLPLVLLPVFVGTWSILAIMLLIGMLSRTASATLGAMSGYMLLLDQQLYSNHQYLLTLLLLLLALSDSGACWGIDARRVGERAVVRAWPVFLIKLQVSVVYGFAALSKINAVYLSGAVVKAHFMYAPAWFTPPWALSAALPLLAALSIGTELFLSIALWNARCRWVALWSGVGLHGFIVIGGASTPFAVLQLANFALIIMAPYLLFFRPRLPKVPALPVPHILKKDD